MSGLLSVLLGYPTVVFTGLLGIVMLYWVFVILGALEIDLFHADADGMLEGLDGIDGAAKGAADAAVDALDGALDGVAKGAADAAVDALDGGLEAGDGLDAHAHAATGLMHALKLRRAPVTVTFTFIVFFSWILSYFGVTYLTSSLGAILPTWLFSTLVMMGSFAASLPMTSLATKPLEKVFTVTPAKQRIDFIGTEVRIRTGSVDEGFGQAELNDGADNLIINVRNDAGNLKRGDRALIIDFDREKEAYIVEAYDAILEDETASRARES